TEITEEDFSTVCSADPKIKLEPVANPACPANGMFWNDAVRYCRLLSELHGFSADDMVIPEGNPPKKSVFPDFRTHTGYRLPIDAEWEYVCRAGTETSRPFGYSPGIMPRYCCFVANASDQTMPVGSLLPNQWGAFDMLGNVAEWCLNFEQPP